MSRNRMRKFRLTIALSLLSIVASIVAAPSVNALSSDNLDQVDSGTAGQDDIMAEIAARKALGFPSDRNYVLDLRDSAHDKGTAQVGIVLTASELKEVERRSRLLSPSFEQAVRERADFAGMYIDNLRGGKVVVLSTAEPGRVSRELLSAFPRLRSDLIVRRTTITEAELQKLADRLFDRRAQLLPGIDIRSTGVDLARPGVNVRVRPDHVTAAKEALAKIQDTSAGIEFIVQAEGTITPSSCTSRDNCANPMKAGIRISNVSNGTCTMGFHVRLQVDYQFFTAGHCGWDTSTTGWYHDGYVGINNTPGLIGHQAATLYDDVHGVDIMRVKINDAQTTNDIYGVNGDVASGGWPVIGNMACASLGRSTTVDCGVVEDNYVPYYHTQLCTWCDLHGATATGITAQGGDSGSPVWEQTSPSSSKKAIGIHSAHADGRIYFARVGDALNIWDATVRTTP